MKEVQKLPIYTPQDAGQTRRSRVHWLGWGLILAGVLVLGTWGTVTAVQLVGHARSLRGHLQVLERWAEEAPLAQDQNALRAAGEHLAGMRADLEAIQTRVGPLLPAGRLLWWVPTYGGDLAAAPELLEMAAGVSAAGDRAVRALSPALDLVNDPQSNPAPGPSLVERVLPVFVTARPQLLAAQSELGRVEQARSRTDSAALSPQVGGLLARLDRLLPWFETAVDAALLAPGLLGAEGARTYLVLVQNNHELRATGGFISGVGELHVQGGWLAPPVFVDSYAVDNFTVPHDLAPADLAQVLAGELWFFRDANWDPDFRTSARRALEVYRRDRGVRADGAIALDLSALQMLMAALGPLQVEGLPEPVSAQNVLQVIQNAWGDSSGSGADLGWWLHRKDFMGPLAGAALAKVLSGRDVDIGKLAQAAKQALDEKHLLLYLEEPQEAALLRARNWDGALLAPSPAQDLLLVVDSNVGFNKVDASIERSISYEVDLADPERPQGRVTLTYRNRSTPAAVPCAREPHYGAVYADLMVGCYWDYVRVFVPPGSTLLQGPSGADPLAGEPAPPVSPTQDLGNWMVWTAFIEVAPGAEKTVAFQYRLPAEVPERSPGGLMRYSLRVQKQSGTAAVPLQVSLRLPAGAELVSPWPAELGMPQGVTTDLRMDRELELTFREATNP